MPSERTRSDANGEPVRLGKRPKSDGSPNDEPVRPSKRPRPDTSDESGQPRKKSKSSKTKDKFSKHKEKNKEKNKHRSTAPAPAPDPALSPDEQAALDARTLKKALGKAARKERKLIERAHRRQVKYLVAKKDVHEEKLKTSWEKAAADGYAVTYAQAGDLTALPPAEIAAFLARESIAITDPDAPDAPSASPLRPILDFTHLPYTAVTAKMPFSSFEAPTPIQAASWPHTLSGRDVIGVAETGSGKTMAFALPCVEAVVRATRDDDGTVKQRDDERRRKKAEEAVTEPRQRRDRKERETEKKKVVRALVVSPTRELAMQTHAQMAGLAELVGLECVCLFGGASRDTQRHLLGRADIIIATPGRLRDFMADGTADLSAAAFVVLDEADRMLDKGFEEDIKEILGQTPSPAEGRQTLMFTATWPESVQVLAAKLMMRPVKIAIGSGAIELQANARITQRVEVIEPEAKESRLMALIMEHHRAHSRLDRILVFCLYKKEATRIENFLRYSGISVGSIHGDLRQEQRTRSLEAFKSGRTPVLVATDVAARGLDIPEVKLVINLTFPLTVEDYVHRIGRTGRAGKPGKAITLFTTHDKTHSGSLINVLKAAGQDVPEKLLSFGSTVKKKEHPIYGAHFREPDPTLKVAAKITFDEE